MSLDFVLKGRTKKFVPRMSARLSGADASVRSLIFFNDETLKMAGKKFNKMLLVLRKEMRKETPVNKGKLRRSVKILENRKGKRIGFVGIVGPDGSAVNSSGISYAPFIIFGYRHWISGEFIKGNNFVFRGFVNATPKIRSLISSMKSDLTTIIRRAKSSG